MPYTKIKTILQKKAARYFNLDTDEISNMKKLKGSNPVYSFCLKSKKYVASKPNGCFYAQGQKEAYAAVKPLGISDEILYFDDEIKIASFIEGKTLTYSQEDKADAIDVLKKVHRSGISISYKYDVFAYIEKYKAVCDTGHAKNLEKLKKYAPDIAGLKSSLEKLHIAPVLCHGDACVTANYLRTTDGVVKLIDWEQAGMADPFLDFAIAAVHQNFDKVNPVWCIEYYLQRKPTDVEKYRLDAYIALVHFMMAAWLINDDEDFCFFLDEFEKNLQYTH